MAFPFPVETAAGSAALEKREALLAEGRGYPIIAGSPDDLESAGYEPTAEGDACLEEAREIDVDEWLAERVEGDPEYYEETHGEWPSDVVPTSAFTGPTNILTREPLPEVAIVLVPATESWQVPCLLGYGGWNECPAPEEHSAVLKRWQERYGATLVAMTSDTIELAVDRPPRSRDDALALAREHYVYCADIVDQGTRTIEALAAALLNAPVWFFWWD